MNSSWIQLQFVQIGLGHSSILTQWPTGDAALCTLKLENFKLTSTLSRRVIVSTSCEITLMWMPQGLTASYSTLFQVMAWCRQATAHYLIQRWPRYMSTLGQIKHQNSASLAFVRGSEFPAQRANNTVKVSIWWRHHGTCIMSLKITRSELLPHIPGVKELTICHSANRVELYGNLIL